MVQAIRERIRLNPVQIRQKSVHIEKRYFGNVFKETIEKLDQVVAIKQLDCNGAQGIREFVVEVSTLSLADHPN
ncbi:unnamed protein product [Eruca vesicaria subsp. sativa]|uniref:Uncharacterized protein n=1 Tax=Eruca vesicaria subsp. sativa TaxID=29727 RepID=A0ABC8M7X2_ERUVS|nr:unnamed protein product [Eruca vesicaria subsp. sativa]